MSNGAVLIGTAERYVGVSEATGSNDGKQIEAWQAAAERDYSDWYGPGDLAGAPWCGIFTRAMARESGVDIPLGLTHPWTKVICDTADALGGLRPTGLAPTGSIIVGCGIHTGLVVRDRGNGLLDTIEGNASNAVRRLVRNKAEWRIVVPPGIAGVAVPEIVMVDSYGFDDLQAKPDTWGGWASRPGRDSTLDRFKAAHPDLWAAAVLLDSQAAPYGFRSGRRGTYGATWKFGGWRAEEIREERIEGYCKARGRKAGEGIRRWRTKVPAVKPAGGKATTGVTTT